MVSLITNGSSTDDRGRPFRRRRALPVIALISVLALLGVMVWVKILTETEVYATTVDCNPPVMPNSPDAPTPQPLGEVVDRDTLLDVAPAPLSETRVRVYNANGQRGQAADVATQLRDYGFASAPDVEVGNDPVYVDQNLQCHGQIRFGPNGLSAASTLWLVAPCAELIEDGRTDDTVDLALGTYFADSITPNADAQEVLSTLRDPLAGTAPAPLDPGLLSAARNARC
ncbi:envelope integrity protein Cei [Rhodococcus spongiicola]|uniref:LytR family transcriptional regulator n=1 Tax=Rhodococcus spongiicola TaxID=2487352 RepID=A0A3S3AAH7_9NOCA|nr:envelope integrity protein Cei [Rhodococcus spongiicola]RVW03504.1 LytR family transcriptional regulator [Rhodococcus spongiicola]